MMMRRRRRGRRGRAAEPAPRCGRRHCHLPGEEGEHRAGNRPGLQEPGKLTGKMPDPACGTEQKEGEKKITTTTKKENPVLETSAAFTAHGVPLSASPPSIFLPSSQPEPPRSPPAAARASAGHPGKHRAARGPAGPGAGMHRLPRGREAERGSCTQSSHTPPPGVGLASRGILCHPKCCRRGFHSHRPTAR